jgi:hypothetical protein
MEYPDFTCLVCGERIPSIFRKERRRGDHYTGDHEVNIEYYDTSKDNYFVRLDNSEILGNQYKSLKERLLSAEKEKLRKEIEESVSKEEYRNLIKDNLSVNIDKNFKSSIDNFNDFLYWFSKPFEKRLPHPRYAINSQCTNSVLKNLNHLEKQKYVVENGEEKVLGYKAILDSNKFSSSFPFVSNFFCLDSLEAKDALTLEIRHFSEFPLVK